MRINNVTTIKPDDFEDEFKQAAEQLGNVLNPFMQQVVELSDGRGDFENRVEVIKKIEMTVDAAGKPLLTDKIQTGKSNIRGMQVIAVFHTSNPSILPDSQPFIVYTPVGNGLVQVSKITGLPANQKFNITFIVY